MSNGEILRNISLMLLCYGYVLLVILVSSRMERLLPVAVKDARKFLHVMIGNLPFVIPFFTSGVYPVLVAAPFVLVTFCASPYAPFPNIRARLVGLAGMTEEGHRLGLVFYATSYTVLAVAFPSQPHIIAAGVFPMAYGDAAASIIGERYGKRGYRIFAEKSLEGSAAMVFVSSLSLSLSLVVFSVLNSLPGSNAILVVLASAIVATLVEGVSPLGFDNLTVPAASALTFLMLSGGT
jgi:phytol kinase